MSHTNNITKVEKLYNPYIYKKDMSNKIDYNSMTRLALIPIGMERGIHYSHKMNKAELITCLEKNDVDSSFVLDKDIQAKCYAYQRTWILKKSQTVQQIS